MKKVCITADFVKAQGWNQQELAENLGIGRTTLQTYLYRKVSFPHDLREKVCTLLGVDHSMIQFEREDTSSTEMEHFMGSETNRRQFLFQVARGIPLDSESLGQMIAAIMRSDTHNCVELQTTLHQRMIGLEDVKNPPYLHRRHILLTLASLPIGLLIHDLSGEGLMIGVSPDEWLPNCAASLTACWHLLAMAGNDILLIESYVIQYLPFLTTWAQHSSSYQSSSAYYAAQAFLLLGLVALHKIPPPLNTQERLKQCVLAVEYARISQDKTLLITSLTHYGNALYDRGHIQEMLKAYLEANCYQPDIPYLLQSKVALELAHSYAQHGMRKESLDALSKAQDLFPGEEETPPFLQGDYGHHSLILFRGLTYLDLGKTDGKQYIHQATNELAKIDHSDLGFIPPRFLAEIRNWQAQAAVQCQDFASFEKFLQQGVEAAKSLNSQKRRQEAFSTLLTASRVWPQESKRIIRLAELFE